MLHKFTKSEYKKSGMRILLLRMLFTFDLRHIENDVGSRGISLFMHPRNMLFFPRKKPIRLHVIHFRKEKLIPFQIILMFFSGKLQDLRYKTFCMGHSTGDAKVWYLQSSF